MRSNEDGCCAATKSKQNRQISGLALFAQKIATEIVDPHSLEANTAGKLIPLNKNPGEEEVPIVRPIGVGEVMRRIVGKAIS